MLVVVIEYFEIGECFTVEVSNPDRKNTITIGSEQNLLAVRAKARLEVVCSAFCQAQRIAASNRQQIQVTEKIEDDVRPLRMNVEVHPGAFTG